MLISEIQMRRWMRFCGRCTILSLCILIAACSSVEERVLKHYESGLELLKDGEPTKASLEFRNALKLNNDFAPALHELAKVEFGRGEYVKAAGFFRKVTEIDEMHLDSRIELSKILLSANQVKEAEKYADQAYALNALDPRVLVGKAAIFLRQQKLPEAVEFAERALKDEANNSDALIVLAAERMASKDPRGALQFLDRGSEEDNGFISLQLFKLAALEALSETDEIERTFRTIIEREPKNTQLRYSFARWYVSKGRKEEAEAIIRAYADENPSAKDARLNLVRFVRAERGTKAALEELKAVIDAQKADAFEYELAYAELLFVDNRRKDAIEFVKAMIVKEPVAENKLRARLYLAEKYYRLSRMADARVLVDIVLQDDPKNTLALEVDAGLLIAENRDVEAIERLIEARELQPESTSILRLLATAYERTGKIELAEESLVKAVQIDKFKPGLGLNLTGFLFRHGKAEHAEDILSRIIENAPTDSTALAELAKIKLRKRQWEEAVKIATTLEEADPKNLTLANEIRAAAFAGQNKFDESIAMLKASQADKTDNGVASSNLFNVYLKAEKYDDARKLIEASLAANPKDAVAHVRAGLLHRLQEQPNLAEAAYKKAIEAQPDAVVGYYALTDFYMKSDRIEEALEIGKKGTSVEGNVLSLRFLLAQIYEKSKRYTEAIGEYDLIFQAEPRSLVAANNLASLLAEHRTGDADLERAYDIAKSRLRNTKVPQFLDTLGRIYYLKGEYADAVSYLRPAAEGMPNVAVAQFHLGMAYKKMERVELATDFLEKAKMLADGKEFAQREELLLALKELSSVEADTKVD